MMKSRIVDVSSNQSKVSAWNEDDIQELDILKGDGTGDVEELTVETEILPTANKSIKDNENINVKTISGDGTPINNSPPIRIIRGKVLSPKDTHSYKSPSKSEITLPKTIKSANDEWLKSPKHSKIDELKSPKNIKSFSVSQSKIPSATPRKLPRSPSPDFSQDLSRRSHDNSQISQDISRRSSVTQQSSIQDVKQVKESTTRHVDNIRMRVQAAKERAGVITQGRHRLKKKSPASSLPSSSVTNLVKDDEEVEEALNKHKEARKKWKHLALISKQVSSLEAEFDFFTRGGSKSTDTMESQEKASIKEETPTDECSVDEEIKLVTERTILTYRPASPQPPDAKDKLRAILFCPSSSPVPVEEKLDGEGLPRFIADEGLYVGDKNYFSSRSKNKLEQRIMASGNERYWFGEDGELKCLTQGIAVKCSQMMQPIEPIDTLVAYMPPCLGWPAVSLESVVTANEHATNDFVLQIDVGRVIIRHHPLFTQEHLLSYNIAHLINSIERREKEDIIGRLAARIESICDSRHHSDLLWKETDDPIHEYRINIYSKEVRRLGMEWIKELRSTREMIDEATELWKELTSLRHHQGYAATDLQVSVSKIRSSRHQSYTELLTRVKKEIRNEEEGRRKKRKEEKKRRKLQELRSDGDYSDTGSPEPSSSDGEEKTESNDEDECDDSIHVNVDLEPKIRLSLQSVRHDLPLPPSSFLQNYEKEFGKGIQVCLRVNNKEVGRAQGRAQQSDRPSFTFNVQYRFSVKLSSKPSSVSIQLLLPRRTVTSSQSIAQLFLQLPPKLHTDEVPWQEMEWSSTDSGCVKGSILIRSGWQDVIPHFLYETKTLSKTNNSLDESGNAEPILDLSYYDSNNSSFDKPKQKDKDSEGCRLNPLQDEFDFCTDKDLENDPRLRLLTLRDRGEPEFVNTRCVPLNSIHLQPNIFKAYEKRISGKSSASGVIKSRHIVPTSGLSPLDSLRSRGFQSYQDLKENVYKQLENHNKKTTAHYVNEPPIYDFYMLLNSFIRWLQPKKILKPRRGDSQRVTVRSLLGQQVEVMLTVVRGLQIPVRSDLDCKSSNPDGISAVRPFVEVIYLNNRQRTFTADGSNPTWNHQIHIPLKVSEDKTLPEGGNLEVILYDEIVEDLMQEDMDRETEVHLNRQRGYLGRITIPINVIVGNPWIEGTFEVNTPPSLLGYARESKELGNKTYLNIQIEVQPTLTTILPRIKEELVDSIEEAELHTHLKNWAQVARQDLPGIEFHTLVITSQAKTVCPTRLISPLFPPVMYPGHGTTAEMAARFVSLIPTAGKTPSVPVNMWLTADELVGGCCGERKDRAVLLTCYFLGLGLKAWLCVGQALPQGICHWVVTKDMSKDGGVKVWDPDRGTCYSAGEPFCPLVKPHCVIDSTNIWINEDERPGWDGRLELSSWRICLGRSFTAPGTLQPPTMAYMETPEPSALQDKLNKLLRHAVMKLRPTTRTIWNRYCSSALSKLLPSLERESCHGNRLSPCHMDHLTHITSSYKVYGVALNSPYTSSSEAVQMVKSCGIHLNTNPNTEFALGVYLHAYPSSVLSLWLYLAVLQTRR